MFSFMVCLVLAADADRKPAVYPRADLLVEPADLLKSEVAGQLRILDARGHNLYAKGHVPGAVWVDHQVWSQKFVSDPGQDAWAKRLGDLGIGLDTKVVIYDDAQSKDAARIWWILRYWGVHDVRLLNGGWTGWQAAGGKADQVEAKPKPVAVKPVAQADRVATKDQLLELVKSKEQQIIDARTRGEFCGDIKTERKSGSVPGALQLEWIDLVDKKTQRFKDADELRRIFRTAGIEPDRPAVTYCQSGGRASVMAFGLELMGGKQVRNYYRSWAEWGNAEDTPVAVPLPKKK